MSLSDIYLSAAWVNYSAKDISTFISLKRIKRSKVGNFISRNMTAATLPRDGDEQHLTLVYRVNLISNRGVGPMVSRYTACNSSLTMFSIF